MTPQFPALPPNPPIILPAALHAFADRSIWTGWTRDAGGHKVPLDMRPAREHPGRDYASSKDPDTWVTFERAHARYLTKGFGLGFMREHDGYAVIDIDAKNLNPEESAADAKTIKRIETFIAETRSYAERSPSGKGYHIIGRISDLSLYDRIGGFKPIEGIFDLFGNSGFVTVTGQAINDYRVNDITDTVRFLLALVPPKIVHPPVGPPIIYGPETRTADEIVAKVLTHQNGEKFRRLMFERDIAWLQATYTIGGKANPHGFDHSAADASLAAIICNATRDRATAFAIFRKSYLYARAGDGRKRRTVAIYENDYLARTFEKIWAQMDEKIAHGRAVAEAFNTGVGHDQR